MLSKYLKAFTLVEMLVALAVSSIIIAATYASYDLVATQYKKNMDIADMHTSGRAIMRIIERDIRMAGFEYRDKDAKVTYGTISSPLNIKDSGNKCCDEVTVIYDYFDEESKKAERIRIRYWAEPHTSNKGSRHRLYKQKDILGQNKKILATPKLGTKDVMADYIEDLQLNPNTSSSSGADIKTLNEAALIAREILKQIHNANKKRFSSSSKYYFSESCTKKGYRNRAYSKSCGRSWIVRRDNNAINSELFGKNNEFINKYGKYFDIQITEKRKQYNPYSWSEYQRTKGSFGYKAMIWFNDTLTKKLFGKCNIPRNHHGCRSNFYTSEKGEENYWATRIYRNNMPTSSKCYTSNTKVNSTCGWGSAHNTLGKKSGSFTQWISDPNSISKFSSGGNIAPTLVGVELTLRTKNQYGKDRQFKKKDYHAGNYKLDKTDKYKRDTFSSTVLVRNLAL
jgi:prepilin-type N-terminal cleavage/methylation domain-containing protein